MAVEPEATQQEVSLSRDMGLLDITMIGVGGMIGAGIFVLMPIAAGVAGPALIVAFALNGLITLITAASYAELGSAFPGAGGGYLWVREALPGPSGFLAGWMLWFAHAAACSLYALGFGVYFGELLLHLTEKMGVTIGLAPELFIQEWLHKILGVAVVAVFTYINFRGASETGKTAILITLGKIVLLGVFIVSGLYYMFLRPDWQGSFTPFMPRGFGSVVTAMGLTFIAFQGYEIIVQCGEEVKNPRRNLPKAVFLAVAIVVPIYCLIVVAALGGINPDAHDFATNWEWLGAGGPVGLVKAAAMIMLGGPAIGGLLWIIGGLLSTSSALNATIYSSSRVSFAMARNRELLRTMSHVHPKRRTPHIAIITSAAIVTLVAVALPINDVASAANIMFLILFLQVNVAVITMRRRRPDLKRGFMVPLMPYIPIVGIATQFFLAINMFQFSWIAWAFALCWIGLGLILYYLYLKPHQRRERHLKAPVVFERVPPDFETYQVLVPVANPEHMENLLLTGAALADRLDGDITALNVITVPDILPVEEGIRFLSSAEKILDAVREMGEELGLSIRTVARVGHHIPRAIFNTIEDDEVDMLVLGWRGWTAESQRVMGTTLDPTMSQANCDIAVLKAVGPIREVKRILAGVTGSPQNPLVVEAARAFQHFFDAEVTYAHVRRPGQEIDDDLRQKYLENKDEGGPLPIEFWEARSPAAELVRRSADYDLFILGSARESALQQLTFGSVTQTLAKHAKCSVLMVKKGPGPLKALAREMFRPLEDDERTEVILPEEE